MAKTKLNPLFAKATEQKYAIIIASTATVAVLSTVIWNIFFTQTHETPPTYNETKSVSITEKPSRLQKQALTPTPVIQKHISTKKDLPITPTPKMNPVTIDSGELYVQVGAFKEIDRARAVYKNMRKTYKHAKIIPKSGYYAIWVGPVATQAEAKDLQKQILKRNKIKGFITSRK